MLKQKNKKGNEGVESFLSSVLAVAAGLLFGLFILLITNSNEMFSGFLTILQGGFVDGMSGISQTLYLATPIVMTGLSVGFAWKTGLFNIGASGQYPLADRNLRRSRGRCVVGPGAGIFKGSGKCK